MVETETHRWWLEHVRRWKNSGLSRGEYAAQAGLNPQTLGWYAWKLKPAVGKGRGSKISKVVSREATMQLAPGVPVVEVLPAVTAASTLELDVAGVTVRVPADFEPHTLSRVLDVLQARR